MGGKHKKHLRSEKAKVKLKGSKLPKGLNVTKTDFKVKKILIREQLQNTENQEEKLNIKEILNRLKHHNASFRMDALKSLKSIATNSNETSTHLAPLLQGVSALCLDIEKDIRRESFKILSLFLCVTDDVKIYPFFDVLSSYLSCALTHIHQSIQEDALLYLDVLLKYVPHLVAEYNDKIFKNFLDMISKNSHDSKAGRVLVSHIGKTQTSVIWRRKILERLEGLLKAFIEYKQFMLKRKESHVSITFVENQLTYCPLKWSNLNEVAKVPGIFNKSITDKSLESGLEGDKIRVYIDQLVPLLIDSWVEVSPRSNNKNEEEQHIVNDEGAYTLNIILQIFQYLWDLIKIWEDQAHSNALTQFFKETYANKFSQHLCNNFPYQKVGKLQPKAKKKGKDILNKKFNNTESSCCQQQNMNTIHLFCTFFNNGIDKERAMAEKILDYLISITSNANKSVVNLSLEKALRAVLYINGDSFMKIQSNKTEILMKNVINLFQNNYFINENMNNKTAIIPLICHIVSNNRLRNALRLNKMENCLSSLPLILARSQMSVQDVDALNMLGKRKNVMFLSALKNSAHHIINGISSLKVNGVDDLLEGQKLAINLFYWIDDWTPDELENIIEKIKSSDLDETLAHYFISIITKFR